MKKTIRKSLGIKVLGVVNCLALCLTAYTANLACNWLYYQEEEPEEEPEKEAEVPEEE